MLRGILRSVLMLVAGSIAGLLVGGFLGLAIDGHGPPPYPWDATPKLATGGLIFGAGGWLFYWFVCWWTKRILEFREN